MKNPWVIIGIITILLFGGAIVFSNVSNKQSNEGVAVTSHVKGNPEAAVTLVEYSDFQCPACAAFQPVIAQILEKYGNDMNFEYKHFPLPIHSFALQAAAAAEAAGQQGKFFEYHDALFENQDEWAKSATPAVFFMKYAKDLGLNEEQFKTQTNSSILRENIQANLKEGRELGLTGTPSFYLNGEKMEIKSYEDFVAQIALAIDPNAFASSTSSTTPGTPEVKFGL